MHAAIKLNNGLFYFIAAFILLHMKPHHEEKFFSLSSMPQYMTVDCPPGMNISDRGSMGGAKYGKHNCSLATLKLGGCPQNERRNNFITAYVWHRLQQRTDTIKIKTR